MKLKRSWLKWLIIAAAGLALGVIIVLHTLSGAGNDDTDAEESSNSGASAEVIPHQEDETGDAAPPGEYRELTSLDDFGDEKWNEGVLMYDGRLYRYNEGLQTYLFMGIDNDGPVALAKDFLKGGQSDAMFLLVIDNKAGQADVVAINRNTMVPVDVFDRSANYTGRYILPICLQHGYGDGMKLSCMMSVEAIGRLFRGIPIAGYLALNVGGRPEINDAIGGVEITPIESVERGDVSIKEGETLTLDGDQAYAYLRQRDVDRFGSANDRLERQKQYIGAFAEKIMNDPSLAKKLVNAGSDYIVSSIDLSRIAESADDLTINKEIYTLDGKTVEEEGFESFYADEDGLIKLILDVFYEEVS